MWIWTLRVHDVYILEIQAAKRACHSLDYVFAREAHIVERIEVIGSVGGPVGVDMAVEDLSMKC